MCVRCCQLLLTLPLPQVASLRGELEDSHFLLAEAQARAAEAAAQQAASAADAGRLREDVQGQEALLRAAEQRLEQVGLRDSGA